MWQPSGLVAIIARLAERSSENRLQPDLAPRDIKMQIPEGRQPTNVRVHNAAARVGPCTFGCTSTTRNQYGNPNWRACPDPSPWGSVLPGATLCMNHYSKGMALRNRTRYKNALLAITLDGAQANEDGSQPVQDVETTTAGSVMHTSSVKRSAEAEQLHVAKRLCRKTRLPGQVP